MFSIFSKCHSCCSLVFRRASAVKTTDYQKELNDRTGSNPGVTLKTPSGTGTGKYFLRIQTPNCWLQRRYEENNINSFQLFEFAGLQYTDTSHEIEALHRELRKFGDGTMDTKDLTLQSSSVSKIATGQTMNSENATGGFGMRLIAPPRTGIVASCVVPVV